MIEDADRLRDANAELVRVLSEVRAEVDRLRVDLADARRVIEAGLATIRGIWAIQGISTAAYEQIRAALSVGGGGPTREGGDDEPASTS